MSSKVRAQMEKQSSELQQFQITSLPYDIIVNIVARVPRCNYPAISVVSKSFRALVSSPELYRRRSLLGCTEHCLYVVFRNRTTGDWRLSILRPKVNNNHLVSIRSLPHRGSYVAVNSKIYGLLNSITWCMDCKSHTVQSISNKPKFMLDKVAEIIDRKIYVIGICSCGEEVSRRVIVKV